MIVRAAPFLLALGLAVGGLAAADAGGPATVPEAAIPEEYGDGAWPEPDATHRLELGGTSLRDVHLVELANLHLPTSLDGGVAVRTSAGLPLPYHYLPQEKALFTAPPPAGALLHVYVGFPEDRRRPNSTWDAASLGDPPEPHRLELTLVRAWMSNEDEEKVLARRDYLRHLREKLAGPDASPEAEMSEALEAELAVCVEARNALENDPARQQEDTKEDIQRQLEHLKQQESEARERLRASRETLERSRDQARLQALAEATRWREDMVRQEREIERFFQPDELRRQRLGAIPVRQALLADNPINDQRNFAARFSGRLAVPRPGCYTFAINSRNGSHLVVDNHLVVAWPHGHAPASGWDHIGEIYLDAGYHDFAFYYQTNTAPVYAAVAWRGPDENHFSLLSRENFSPAAETILLGCADADGLPHPVVRAEPRGWFLLGDESRAAWVDCTLLPETWDWPFAWSVDGQPLDVLDRAPSLALPLDDGGQASLALVATTDGFPDLPIPLTIDIADRHRHDPLTRLTLWTPSFLYDDERLQMDVEVVSEMTADCRVRLRAEPRRPHPLFPGSSEWLDLPGRDGFAMTKYSPSYVWKKPVMLVGRDLATGLDVAYTLDLPPLLSQRQDLRFVPLPEMPDNLVETPHGLADPAGARVIPLLHRLTLTEKRSWAFSRALATELSPCRKLLIIADDVGSGMTTPLSRHLQRRLAGRNVELVFLPWPTAPLGGTTVRAGVAALLSRLQKTDADRILLVPPAADLTDGIPVRLQKRAIAALVEACHRNSRIRTLILATPLPCRRDNSLEPELVRAIYELASEYNTGSLDLNRWMRTRPGWESAYRRNLASAAVYEPLPVQWADDLAKYLAENIF